MTNTGWRFLSEGEMRLAANRMEVYYARGRTGQQMGKVKEIRARGRVKLTQGKNHGLSRLARYDIGKQVLWLEGGYKQRAGGNAVLRFGKDRMEGRKIRMEMGKDRRIRKVRVVGGVRVKGDKSGGRVKVTIGASGLVQQAPDRGDGKKRIQLKDVKTSVTV